MSNGEITDYSPNPLSYKATIYQTMSILVRNNKKSGTFYPLVFYIEDSGFKILKSGAEGSNEFDSSVD